MNYQNKKEPEETKPDFLENFELLVGNLWRDDRCIVFNFKKTDDEHISELTAYEIKNFKLTCKNFHMHIQKGNHTSDIFTNKNENYYQNIEEQLNDLKFFIGKDSYLIIHTVTDYHLLKNELKKWGLVKIKKERFICISELTKKMNFGTLENFCNFKIPAYQKIDCDYLFLGCEMISKLFIFLCFKYNEYEEKSNNKTENIIEIEEKSINKTESSIEIEEKSSNKTENNIEIKEKIINKTKNNIEFEKQNNIKNPYAYVGTYSNSNKDFYYGGFIMYDNNKIHTSGIVDEKDYKDMGSPGAEMFACKKIINLAIKYNIKKIDIYTYYDGIINFIEETYKPKKAGSKRFVEFIKKLDLETKFVKPSSDNKMLAEAKQLAKSVSYE